jgi:hypothetical protein
VTIQPKGAFVVKLTPQPQSEGVDRCEATGALTGLAGAMTITIADGKHSYPFEYALFKGP